MASATFPTPMTPAPPALPTAPASGLPRRPDPPSEDRHYELINDQWVEKAVSFLSARLGFRIAYKLESYVEGQRAGICVTEALFAIPAADDPGRQRRPDAAFVSAERWPLDRPLPPSDPLPIAPDIAVEVISPSNRWTEVDEKLDEYFAAGVRLLLVINPASEKIYAYTSPTAVRILTRADTLDAAPVLPDFRLPLAELFGPAAIASAASPPP